MPSASDLVYAELRRRLMSGAFLPGERLREERIASELSVSRTPVRQAIERLIEDGLVAREPHRGAVVLGWSDRDIEEAFELRLLLEPYAARAAALRAEPEHVEALQSANDQMLEAVQSGDEDCAARIQHYNNRFHHALLSAAQSARVRTLVENLVDLPILIGSFYFYSRDNMLSSVEQHRQIISAIRAKDPDYAETAMRLHLTATRRLFLDQRKTTPQAD
ncbi:MULTISPECIES: GntR family transcriptional regulator [unclassified Bordetella]|uniref:GntR family transcriptional regulator n=1 Tax=unclassified Bordetella TaxID=2630031 RepID=UPI0013286317|nr:MULTISPECIES: GntR family transcriptional regulator [unclassified Bordetella]MVW70662.1 FCD domain-containing protein [Bordetella sp. 15P40C-2]MVW77558.1 FCD domain-containing protein [Bordetella sp. 02P26C-1]